jgi:hypothetical protein
MISLPLFYFGNVGYWSQISQLAQVQFISDERFVKQTLRNRTLICGANGVLKLVVPVSGRRNYSRSNEILLDNQQPWASTHFKSLKSAYNLSPYFYHYEQELALLLNTNYEFLWQLNQATIHWVAKKLKLNVVLFFQNTEVNQVNTQIDQTLPEHEFLLENQQPYYQNFSEKWGFNANMSILDVLFMMGPQASEYLRNTELKAKQ